MLRDKWGTLSRRVPQRRRAPAVSRLHDPDLHRRPAGSHALAGVPDKAAQILASIIRYGIVGLVVGWVMSGCAGRQACREHAVPRRCDRARRYCRTDERWRLHFSTGHGSGMRGAFRYARVSVFSPGDAASCVAPCPPRLLPKGLLARDDAVSSMARSHRWTAAPRSPCRNGCAATFFPWASPIPRGDKKVAALPSCAALRP